MPAKHINEIFDLAIRKEEEAAKFYTEMADRMESPHMRQVFLDFAKEEQGHKAKLAAMKEGKRAVLAAEKVIDLKIAESVQDVEPCSQMDYQKALVLAMKNEKAAFRLYSDLAGTVTDESLKSTLQMLAQEEARHKLRFEIEYDELMQKGEN